MPEDMIWFNLVSNWSDEDLEQDRLDMQRRIEDEMWELYLKELAAWA